MSVIIKNREMPEGCVECWNRFSCKHFEISFIRLNTRHPDCPLIEVLTPHGDLIDRDALNIGEYEREDADSGTLEISLGGLLSLYHKVIDAPTVIEAEGE